ncbi:methyl-accepting chemotaxis protein [Thiohalospira halophila DSM 15071]|uniref:Methyl-accepting chemotaxis protein n=1 Tax=Thiohalospira halophila DSM 15071 TaxID=1123397 RepID=A0A1I1Q3G6_9GAMM|nr:methyl-accepting chemotaxis protein [Thiohalospira halophila]SFD16589.1 methyl-accepting chemotaxis protein [Thiohalospira halophila DSM 15071]
MVRFKNLSLAKKLSLGFGLVLALLAIISVVAFNSLSTSSDGFAEYRETALSTKTSGEAQANLLEARMAALKFVNDGSEAASEAEHERHEATLEFLDKAEQYIHDPDQQARLTEAREKTQQYGEAFAQVEEYKAERNRLFDEVLAVEGPIMEQRLTDIMRSAKDDGDASAAYVAGQAMRNLLLARLYVVKFLEDNSQSAVDRVNSEFGEFDQRMATLDQELQNPERRRLMQEVNNLKDVYTQAFDKTVETILARNEVKEGTMDVVGPEVADILEDIKIANGKVQDEIGPRVQGANERAMATVPVVSLVALVVGVFMAWVITRAVTRPVARVTEFVERFGEGDLTADLTVDSEDEVGRMSRALSNAVGRVRKALVDVSQATSALASASEEVSATSQSLSQGATEQASSVEETSATVEQARSSIQQNTENAKSTDEIATGASKKATEGGEAVRETVTAMNNIADKVTLIEDIAYKTNLLALNAAIEAARAGEHGKGFAVVAEEVRKLAERSQSSAGEISEMAGESVKVAERAGGLIDEVVPEIRRTADLVQEISASSEEQATGANQLAQAIEQLDTVAQQNASSSEELASTSEEMSSQAQQLQETVSFFELGEDSTEGTAARGGTSRGTQHAGHQGSTNRAGQASASHGVSKPAPAEGEAVDESEFQRFS